MKKLLLLLVLPVMIFTFNSCSKDKDDDTGNNGDGKGNETVQPNALPVVIYIGGTWCPPCGANGKPAMQATKKEIGDKAVYISAQVNGQSAADPMNNQAANELLNAFRPSGVPAIYTACPDSLAGTQANGAAVIQRLKSGSSKKALVHSNVKANISGNSINVEVDARFFEDFENDYGFAVYVTESRLMHTQASDARLEDKNMHDDVIRVSLSGTIPGDVVNGPVKKGDTVKRTYTGNWDASWKKENAKVVVVYWRKPNPAVNSWTLVGGNFVSLK
jgi:hypothetical protein